MTRPIVSADEWSDARRAMLVKEKAMTRAHDALAAERRRMPRMAVDKDYTFEGPDGPVGLLDLFEGRSQLIIYRFFFEPGVHGWPRERLPRLLVDGRPDRPPRSPQRSRHHVRPGLPGTAGRHRAAEGEDGLGRPLVHDHRRLRRRLRRRRVARHQRLPPGRRGQIFRTYFVDARGDEALGSTWSYLDLAPFGRQEQWEDSPEGYPQTRPYEWWRRHDEYEGGRRLMPSPTCGFPVEELRPRSPAAAPARVWLAVHARRRRR